MQSYDYEHSESFDHPGGEFELDGSVDRPGAKKEDTGPGDAFEMDAKMPKRSFEHSESVSHDEEPGPSRLDLFEMATTEPTQAKRGVTLTPTTLQPTH